MTGRPRVSFDDLQLEDHQSVSHHGRPFTGTAFESYPDGGPRSEMEYVDGQPQGAGTEWYPSGRVHERSQWWRGARHGTTRVYDEGGNLTAEREHQYGVLVAERAYRDGELTRDWRIGPDDNLWEVLRLSRQRYGASDPTAPS